jgi:hypothetical protein
MGRTRIAQRHRHLETTNAGEVMNRNTFRTARGIAAITLALGASLAFADDNSMSPLTGDSYAFFNGLDYNPGHFNTRRVAKSPERDTVVKTPQDTRDGVKRPILLADRPRVTLPCPFRDDKGA